MQIKPSENFEQAGHVKASATAGIAFLAVHPLGAKGDECMNGPHRKALLAMGAFGTLLRAALTSVGDPECDLIVQQVWGRWGKVWGGGVGRQEQVCHAQGCAYAGTEHLNDGIAQPDESHEQLVVV